MGRFNHKAIFTELKLIKLISYLSIFDEFINFIHYIRFNEVYFCIVHMHTLKIHESPTGKVLIETQNKKKSY